MPPRQRAMMISQRSVQEVEQCPLATVTLLLETREEPPLRRPAALRPGPRPVQVALSITLVLKLLKKKCVAKLL